MLPLLPPSLLLLLALLPAPSDALPSPLPSYPPPNPPQSSGPIPDYVLAHAPLIHLAQTESYWPSSVASHLAHTRLHWTNGTLLSPPSSPSSPPAHPDLSALAAQGNRSDLYLEGGVMAPDFEAGRAAWLGSAYGVPDARGRSQGEVYIVLVDKGDIIAPGYLDAFFFTFYSCVPPLACLPPSPVRTRLWRARARSRDSQTGPPPLSRTSRAPLTRPSPSARARQVQRGQHAV